MAPRRKPAKKPILEIYKCSNCGHRKEIPRKSKFVREHKHRKTMECTKCEKITNFHKVSEKRMVEQL